MTNDLTTTVEKVLKAYPETRDSDTKLIYCVYRCYGLPKGETFESVISKLLDNQLPAFASITRAKRKVVETHPELDCSAKVREFRNEQEKIYKEYARQ